MALKDILGKSKSEPEHYWALTIEPGWVQAGVWRVKGASTQILSTSPPTAWELEDELVEAVDTALSASIQDFPEDTKEPEKAVFGVTRSWVKDGDIKEEYLDKIKKICSKLTLTPLGFVVLPEAVAHFIKSEEGTPINSVVLGISKDNIEISVFRLGKLSGSSQVARSLSVVDDTVEGLTRFATNEPFPSRFILYDGRESELEEIRQVLLRANWEDYPKLKFLHTPKIETINAKLKVHAVALAGASELADVTAVDTKLEANDRKEEAVQDEELVNVTEIDRAVTPEELGFALEEDVAAISQEEPEKVETPKEKVESESEEVRHSNVNKDKKGAFGILTNMKGKLPVISLAKILPSLLTGRRTVVTGIVAFLLVMVVILAFYWFYPKAEVTIYVSTKTLEEKVELVVDPSATSPDISSRVLPGKVLTTSVEGDKTRSTTGTKTVGDKATGEVTLYRVGSSLSIASGTLITGPDNLSFTLNTDVTVASGSAGTPGTANVKVTSSDIGAQYNLAGDTTFAVGNYSTSDIEGKSGASFSGGSSREISAVSSEDQDILEEELTEELIEKSKKELLEKISEKEIFIDEAISATASSRTFSDKIGDEAESLKLSLSLDTQVITIDKDALFKLSEEVLKDKIPEGFVLRSEQIEANFDFEREMNGTFVLDVSISVNLLPEIDPNVVIENIAGKYPPLVQDYFVNEIPGFSRAEVNFNKPRFPGKLGTFPRLVDNIEVLIAAEK